MKKKVLFLSVALLSASYLDKTSDATIYVQGSVGTQGLSIGASYYFKNIIGVRGVFDWLPGKAIDKGLGKVFDTFIGGGDEEEADKASSTKSTFYDYGFDLSVRPFRGAFRIDAGIRVMDYRVKLSGVSQVENAHDYYYAYKGENEFIFAKGVKPYLGLGWDFNPVAGLIIGLDVGVIYTGKWKATSIDPQLDTGDSTPEQIAWMRANRPYGIQSAEKNIKDMETEPNKFMDKVNGVQFWPVVKFNIGYKFDIL